MTPEKARELLDGDFRTETHPEWVGGVQADFDSFSGAYISATPGHEALYDAAHELAETIAEMQYEYAVQVKRDEGWVMEEDSYWGPYSVAIVRFGRTEGPARIVRRLVSEPEVIES